MSADAFLAGPFGPAAAILAMTLATYLCRVSGALLISRVRITPAVERALAALPGSIVAATVAPLAIRSGPAGILGIVASIATARLLRNDIAALAAGLLVASACRALGL